MEALNLRVAAADTLRALNERHLAIFASVPVARPLLTVARMLAAGKLLRRKKIR
jgi:hypothetical protein